MSLARNTLPARPATFQASPAVLGAARAISEHVNRAMSERGSTERVTPEDMIRVFMESGADAEYQRIFGVPCPGLPSHEQTIAPEPPPPARPAPKRKARAAKRPRADELPDDARHAAALDRGGE